MWACISRGQTHPSSHAHMFLRAYMHTYRMYTMIRAQKQTLLMSHTNIIVIKLAAMHVKSHTTADSTQTRTHKHHKISITYSTVTNIKQESGYG